MHQKRQVTILTDESSWMNQYGVILERQLVGRGYKVSRVSAREDIKHGDIAFFLSCFEIVKGEFLKRNIHNIVVHASALPSGKGWSPTTWQILEGKNVIPLTLFEAVEQMDSGDIYLRDEMKLEGTELIEEWQAKLGMKIVDMCLKFVAQFDAGQVRGYRQCGQESFYARRHPRDSKLDIDKTIAEQFNLLRVVDNEKYPAFFEMNGKRYTLKITQER